MVTRWLPTLLHPKLPEIAKNVARFVQEETIALIVDSLQSEWFAATNKETKPWTPQDVGVTVPPSRRLRPLPPPSWSVRTRDVRLMSLGYASPDCGDPGAGRCATH